MSFYSFISFCSSFIRRTILIILILRASGPVHCFFSRASEEFTLTIKGKREKIRSAHTHLCISSRTITFHMSLITLFCKSVAQCIYFVNIIQLTPVGSSRT